MVDAPPGVGLAGSVALGAGGVMAGWWLGCEPKLWDQAAAFDDASGWLRLAGADGLSASAAQ
jgi:hypothetical protein